MQDLIKILIILSAVGIILLPFGYHIKRFSELKAASTHTISYNPDKCYECFSCGCEYKLNRYESYTLNRYDKTICIYDQDMVIESKFNAQGDLSVNLKIPEYVKMIDCLKYYSKNPSGNGN